MSRLEAEFSRKATQVQQATDEHSNAQRPRIRRRERGRFASAASLTHSDLLHLVSLEVGRLILSQIISKIFSRMALAKQALSRLHLHVFPRRPNRVSSRARCRGGSVMTMSSRTGCDLRLPASWCTSLLPPIAQSIFCYTACCFLLCNRAAAHLGDAHARSCAACNLLTLATCIYAE